MNYFFRRFMRVSLRKASIVYRLIDMTLVGNFFDDPFRNRNFAQKGLIGLLKESNEWIKESNEWIKENNE